MKEYDVVQAWLDNVAYSHSKSVNTGLVYRHGLEQFCKFTGQTPKGILEDYERSEEKDTRRKYAQLLRAFIGSLSREGMTVNTIDCKVGAIRSFFKHNDLPLGYVPMARKHVVYHNRDISKEEIQQILKVSNIRDNAFYSMMAQSGLRPETLCSLRLRHIEPDFSNGIVPCKVDVPEELAKGAYHAYFTFMAEDSMRYLKAYLTTRPGASKESFLFANHGTEDQANPKSFSRIFARTIQKQKEKGTIDYRKGPHHKPSELRLYNLRKYFRKYANQAGFEFVQFWMGHTVREGVDDHYRPKDVGFHRELYAKKAMPHLRLESATPSENEKTIKALEQRMEKLQEENKQLQAERVVIKDLVEKQKQLEQLVPGIVKQREEMEAVAERAIFFQDQEMKMRLMADLHKTEKEAERDVELTRKMWKEKQQEKTKLGSDKKISR